MKKKWLISSIITLALIGSFFFGQQFSSEVAARSSTLWRTLLLKTGQITAYLIGDDGDKQKGITKAYVVNSAGSQSGNATVDSPHYAAATIAFAATTPGTITDSANLLATVLTGDTIKVYNSTSNSGVYTVSTGGVAGTIRTTEATVAELAGAYITILKRATHSNNTVKDLNTGLEWARYVQTGPIGPASNGKLNWYDATKCYTLHPANADVGMVAGNILRIVGLDEASRFFAGAVLVCSGFANAVNKLPGLVVKSVSFTGGNTDIVVDPGNQVLIAEATGNFGISIVCRSIYSYCAAANVALLGGYGDWRIPNDLELVNLRDLEQPTAMPDAVAFPGWINNYIWSSTTHPYDSTYAVVVLYTNGAWDSVLKTPVYYVALVRGG